MIAPDPALAGPRPATPQREAPRGTGREPRGGGDFDSVLKEPAAEGKAEPEAGRAEALAAAVAVPPMPEAAMAAAAVVPAVPAPPGEAAAAVEAAVVERAVVERAVVERAVTERAVVERAAAPVPVVPAAAIPPEAAAPSEARGREEGAPAVAARADGAPARGKAARPAAGVPPGEIGRPKEMGGERRELAVAEAPRRGDGRADAPVRETAAVPAAPAAAPAGEAGVQGLAVREAVSPAWHLAVDAGQAPARSEPVAVQALPAARPQVQAVAPAAVAGQVAVAIGRASEEKLEIRLDPPELGKVQIHLTRHEGGIQAVVLADRPETQDLLRRHAEVLVRELGQAGYDSVSLAFAGGDARAGREEGRSLDWMQVGPAQPGAAEAAVAAAQPRRSAAGGLDVRL